MGRTHEALAVGAAVACLSLALCGPVNAQKIEVDKDIPSYEKVSGVSGTLNSAGSDTLNNLMTLWAEGFKKIYPNVTVQIEGKGSSTAPPALIEATAQLGPMSRMMKRTEVDNFERKFGYKPTAIATSLDSLAVFVNKDNPIDGLSLKQVDAIFSRTRRCGHVAAISTWGEAGLDGAWQNAPISLYGRNSASGTYGYFKGVALCRGDFKDTVKEQPGSASVVQAVSTDRDGIGYSGIGYETSGVRAIELSENAGQPVQKPDYASVVSGRYPLARFLYVYVNKNPSKPLERLTQEFLTYVLSKPGQQVVVKDGYYPLSAAIVERERAKLK